MISPLATLLAGTATHAGTTWVPSAFRSLLEYMKFLTVQGNAEAMKYHKLYVKDVEGVRGNKDSFFKTTRRYIAWAIILLIALLFIFGGFSHFSFFTQSENGLFLRLFMGPHSWTEHSYTHTFVLTPSIEQALFYVLGFFLGVMGNR